MKRVVVALLIGSGVLSTAFISTTGHSYQIRKEAACLSVLQETAATIIEGTCTAIEPILVETPKGGKVPATRYTFSVKQTFKGEPKAGESWTFDQFGWQRIPDNAQVYIPPISATYHTGEDYIVFLYGESGWGLTSAVGFDAGKFRVTKDARGEITVTNGLNNDGLMSCGETEGATQSRALRMVSSQSEAREPVSYEAFTRLLKESN